MDLNVANLVTHADSCSMIGCRPTLFLLVHQTALRNLEELLTMKAFLTFAAHQDECMLKLGTDFGKKMPQTQSRSEGIMDFL